MVKYDFDKVYNRENSGSIKWDRVQDIFGYDVIPMWIADMDFPVAKPIINALQKRIEHPFFGYTDPDPSLSNSVIQRMKKKFGWEIKPEWIVFTPGVIPALNTAVRSLTHPGDDIILQQPVYHPFFNVVKNSGCQIVNNGLLLKNGLYEMDYADLELKFHRSASQTSSNRTKVIILCNPHNPIGRLWQTEELIKMGKIVIRNGGIVISDEIHCEILFKGYHHTPFAMLSQEFEQNCIVCMSPSKTFNLAGLEVSSIIIPNKKLRDEFNNVRSGILPGPNLLAYKAMEAAYRYGDEWLNQMLEYLQGNLNFLQQYFTNEIRRIKVIQPQGTYLIWLDCRELHMDDQSLRKFIREKAKLGLDDGFIFGEGGSGFERMNIACPRLLLKEALTRLRTAVNSLMS